MHAMHAYIHTVVSVIHLRMHSRVVVSRMTNLTPVASLLYVMLLFNMWLIHALTYLSPYLMMHLWHMYKRCVLD